MEDKNLADEIDENGNSEIENGDDGNERNVALEENSDENNSDDEEKNQSPENLDEEEPPEGSMTEEDVNSYGGYDVIAALSASEAKKEENQVDVQDSTNPENQNGENPESESSEFDTGTDEGDRQSQMIDEAKADDKGDFKNFFTDNKGVFFQRNKVLLVVAGVFVLAIIFFALVFPSFKGKKKKNPAMSKAGYANVPDYIAEDEDDFPFESGNSASPDGSVGNQNGNSAINEEEFEKQFPPPATPEEPKKAPVSTGGGGGAAEVPLTNRNEQQKSLQRLSLDDSLSSKIGLSSGKSNGNQYQYGASGYQAYGGGSGSFTPSSLSSNMQNYIAQMSGNGNSYATQNNQSAKQQFLKNGAGQTSQQWNSQYSLWKGTVISAVLDTGINTDLPGNLMAHVTKNVYSSLDSKYLLIPQGSRLYGEYNSEVTYGQKRVQVVWTTLIRPDGLEINLGSMEGIDAYGFAGYRGWKSDHPFEYMKAMGLIAMFSVLDTKMMNQIDTQDNMYAQNAMSDVYSEAKKLNNKIIDRALDIQPTITIQPGTEVSLITNVTIDLPPLEDAPVTQKYVRQ